MSTNALTVVRSNVDSALSEIEKRVLERKKGRQTLVTSKRKIDQ